MTVVIPTRNRATLVVRAIESVLSQTFTDLELVVVDDGSTDDTAQVLRSMSDPRLRVLKRSHEGRSAARNAGAIAATGELLTFLDSDDVAEPTWLCEMVGALDGAQWDLALAGGYFMEPDGQLTAHLPDAQSAPVVDVVAPLFLAGCWILPRTVFVESGGYDPDIHYGENSEFAIRLFSLKPGLRVRTLERPLIRMTRRTDPVDCADQVASALAVLGRYRDQRRLFPKTWASYNSVVGVDFARRRELSRARRHFVLALIADPLGDRRLGRLVAASIPLLARRLWRSSTAIPSVMFIVLAPGVGGSVRSLATVLKDLPARRLVAGPAESSTSHFLQDRGLVDAYIDLPDPSRSRVYDRFRATLLLARIAWKKREHLVAIHANGLAELNLSLLPALLCRRPIVVWVHEWRVPAWTQRIAPILRVSSSFIRYAAVSQTSLKMLRASGLVRGSNASIVANPIDPYDVRAERRRPADDHVVVAYLGTPASYKGFHLLPDLVRRTRDDGIHWAVYSGPRTMMNTTFRELDDLGVNVRNKVSDVREIYGSCDVVVVPSLEESFGRVAAEAMANGLPVVASDLPALRELIGDDCGLLVAPGDTNGMAEALRRLASDPELRKRLGQAGLKKSDRFVPGSVVEELCGLYSLKSASVPNARL